MKKLLLISIFSMFTFVAFSQNYKGYNIEAFKRLEAKEAFVIGGDTLFKTTQVSGLDSFIVTKDYLLFDNLKDVLPKSKIGHAGDFVVVTDDETQLTYRKLITDDYYEAFLKEDEDSINVGFPLSKTSLVFINGDLVLTDYWSKTDSTLFLLMPIVQNDMLIVKEYRNILNNDYYEGVLAEAATGIDVGFTIKPSALVIYNGSAIMSMNWSRNGEKISFNFPVKEYDTFVIKN